MLRKLLSDELGYSLVEVMASIVILTVAVIPMVAMFDSGLKAANTSGNYDTARAFANKKLEQAKSLTYAQVESSFPRPGDGTPTPGTPAKITNAAAPHGVPNGFSYSVSKRYLAMAPGASAAERNLSTADPALGSTGLIEVTVTVYWGSNKSYEAAGIVARDVP